MVIKHKLKLTAESKGIDELQVKMIAAAVALAILILIFDLSLPLGVAGGVPYVALVLLGTWFPKPRHIIFLALAGTALTIVGFFGSPNGGIPWVVFTNRALVLFAIWITAALLIYVKNVQIRLWQLKGELQRYVDIVDKYVITSTTTRDGIITSVSDAFCRISGYGRDELIGRPHNIIRHPDMPKSLYKNLWSTILSGGVWQGEIKNRRKDGGYYWVDVHIEPVRGSNGEISGFTSIRQDISNRKRVEELSITDQLTRMFNRMKLDEELHKELVRAERYGHGLSVILLDVDFFKSVNDVHGHQVGDQVLIQIAELIRSNVRNIDIPGRWGGEEFLIICPETEAEGAVVLAEKLRQVISNYHFPSVGTKTCSFGVATRLAHEDEGVLVGRADAALYQAKHRGRNRVEIASDRLLFAEPSY